MGNLTVGIDLSNRTITCSIPDNTQISTKKIIAKIDSNNYIAEENNTVYIQYYSEGSLPLKIYIYNLALGINLTSYSFNDYGSITEVDETSVCYQYLTRTEHEKAYLITEDAGKVEGMSKEDIEDGLAAKVNTSDIVDDLTHSDTNKPLSAKQGKALNDSKVNTSDIVNDLTHEDINKPLSAKQGKTLKDLMQKHIVMLTLSEDYTLTEWAKIPLTSKSIIGNKLTYSDNQVVIGSDVNKIKVSFHSSGTLANDDEWYYRIIKNSTSIVTENFKYPSSTPDRPWKACISDYIINVSSGDTISVYGQAIHSGGTIVIKGTQNNVDKTWLTVEAVS